METLENAKVGQKIRWKTPKECPGDDNFITAMATKYPGVLCIARLTEAPHGSSDKITFEVTHDGHLITPELDDYKSCSFSPFWFMSCD